MFKRFHLPRLWKAAILAWVMIAALTSVQDLLTRGLLGYSVSLDTLLRYPIVECAYWALCTPVIFAISSRTSLKRTELFKSLLRLLCLFVVLWSVHGFYRSFLHGFVYPTPLPNSVYSRAPLLRGVRFYLLGNLANDLWIFSSVVGVHQVFEHYSKERIREKQLVEAQLLLLKRQLQPHFLFNALNSISALMHANVDAADNMMTELSQLLRKTLKNEFAHKDELANEIALLRSYLSIEKIRFGERLTFSLVTDKESEHVLVPSLILQPLVENAVIHGISVHNRRGAIDVRAHTKDGRVLLTVADNGAGIDKNRYAEGVGLRNTRARLRQLYGDDYVFDLGTSESGGTLVTIGIPFEPSTSGHTGDGHAA